MTFEEWWDLGKHYFERSSVTMMRKARGCWREATKQERERCAEIVENTKYLGPYTYDGDKKCYSEIPGWARKGMVATIRELSE